MTGALLPDPYWAGMITGRVVHLHLGLVEEHLVRAHREQEQALAGSASVAVLSALDGTRAADRVLARLLAALDGHPLPEGIRFWDTFTRVAPGLLVHDDADGGVTEGVRRAFAHAGELGLGPLLELGCGLAALDTLPREYRPAADAGEAVLLPARTWTQPTPLLTGQVLREAAVSLGLQWARAETAAYRLPARPPGLRSALADFAHGVLAEYRRRAGGPVPVRAGVPAQVAELPLLSELVRCWWPSPGRARHVFGSPFDHMTTLEVPGACR
ncbi:hypothetical protein JOF53_000735 [Crossiella equi]|uniref:Uncharacterized protein n=1 Tax=Crossiella equi TaxID=130796 RepID=A0ABS5A5J4_9PSEU|nr:hypothetical protein [Crossiella equi]MBP2471863.1 hypothetical protein [Crossiella equi]